MNGKTWKLWGENLTFHYFRPTHIYIKSTLLVYFWFSSVESTAWENLLCVCIFLVTPLIPVAIIYKAVSFSIQRQRLKAKWQRSNDVKVTSVWFSLNIIERKNRTLMMAYSDLKIVEASLEAIPQIYFLLVFSLASWVLPDVPPWPHIATSHHF